MTGAAKAPPWPDEVKLDLKANAVTVRFDNGDVFVLEAEYLRVLSPSAEVRGHGGKAPKAVGGKRDVKMSDMKAVGNYAVRILFDDGHDTGLYSWEYLHELGRDRKKLWAEYLERLSAAGRSREP